jgi:hypothetical protein
MRMKYEHYLKAHGGSKGTTVSGMSFDGSPAILEPCCLSPGQSPPLTVAGSATLWLTACSNIQYLTVLRTVLFKTYNIVKPKQNE